MAASEMLPFAKTGGLADVMGALPRELASLGHRVATLVPFYRVVRQKWGPSLKPAGEGVAQVGGTFLPYRIWKSVAVRGVEAYFIDRPEYFDRAELYGEGGRDFPDNAERFVFFNRAVVDALERLAFQADIVHSHDWHAALLPALLEHRRPKNLAHARTVLTVHNLAFQGVFPAEAFALTGLPEGYFTPETLEFYGGVNFLKAGLLLADALSTVSRKYAEEIQTLEYGCALDDILRYRGSRLHGILNGVDLSEWDPARDPALPAKYDAKSVETGKAECKRALQKELGLPEIADAPLFGCISRLTEQKGFSLFAGAIPELLRERPLQIVVLGRGEARFEGMLRDMSAQWRDRVRFVMAMDNALAHRIEAACDYYLMPSQFEPCGLNQMYSLRYGTVPIVRATGGLDDTVQSYHPNEQSGNGFKFVPYEASAFAACIRDALGYYRRHDHWPRLRQNGMAGDFSWSTSAAKYVEMFRLLVPRPLSATTLTPTG
ncbi:MAG: glycogen synthase GlgA, partial [Verrucomicrobiae bacterium]|nr:glycogen synthase GlgA [Verrucomicrobiae bacterium]